MRLELSDQAAELLGKRELVIITEQVDDVALLIGQMIKMGLAEVLDRHIPRHWKQRGLSRGWTAVIWLAYILTERDHRKVSVASYIQGMKHTLSQLSGQDIEALDFSDDRLAHLLKHLSQPRYWHAIEHDLNARSIEVYELPQQVIRCDATTVSGDHEVVDGGRQITDEATLVAAIDAVLNAHRVAGLLDVEWEKQIERTTRYVGRGRGAARREQQVIEHIRYQITRLTRRADPIAALTERFGWKAFVTNATQARLSLNDAILCYRNEYRVERIFNRLKSRVHIAPMFVTRRDQIAGLTHLLTLGVRVLTVTAFVLRRSLQQDQAKLPGLHPENKQKMTDKPTAERILKAFSKVSLTIIKAPGGKVILRRLTALSGLQEDILQRLGLGIALYEQLEIQEIGN